MKQQSLQETFGPETSCFGCGPANPGGLHLQSYARGNKVVADWRPEPKYEAFPNVLNGGIIGTLLDCHSNWTAAWHLKEKTKANDLPSTVTAEFTVKLHSPTPSTGPIFLSATVVESTHERAIVDAELSTGDKVHATFRGTFVAVKPGHPGFQRW